MWGASSRLKRKENSMSTLFSRWGADLLTPTIGIFKFTHFLLGFKALVHWTQHNLNKCQKLVTCLSRVPSNALNYWTKVLPICLIPNILLKIKIWITTLIVLIKFCHIYALLMIQNSNMPIYKNDVGIWTLKLPLAIHIYESYIKQEYCSLSFVLLPSQEPKFSTS